MPSFLRHRAFLFAALAAGTLVFAATPSAGLVPDRRPVEPGEGARTGRPGGIRFEDRGERLVLAASGYRLTLSGRNGALLELADRRTGARLVRGQNGCLWGAAPSGEGGYVGGCGFDPDGPNRFSYRWDRAKATLTLTYDGDDSAQRRVEAVVSLAAGETFFDLRLRLESRWRRVLALVVFPPDLFLEGAAIEAGYAPNFLPGVRLNRSFFERVGNNVLTYPSRWAFADYLALDLARSHLAVYSVNPAPNPLAPVDLGFLRNASPAPCSEPSFCLTHAFQTWIRDGETWTSPVVRVRVGQPVEETILAYRDDNGIDAYPSLQEKLGGRLDTLAQAPLVKADLWKGLPAFREWGPNLRRLPSPSLLHPVAFQPGGHDENGPDFLPPDPRWGTTGDFRAAIAEAKSLGIAVMPYLNVSWWDDTSPTLRGLPASLTLKDVAVQDDLGRPVAEQYGGHNGYLVSPHVPFVRDRVGALMEEWRSEVPVDCLFFDQIGARPWRRDFNPAAPTPLAYDDGWLAAMAPYADRCLMAEDGWDRLAGAFAGFHGGLLLMEREHDWLDTRFGEGTWEPHPLALWLLHDKVLLYQHDLYEGTLTADLEALTWNAAFGFVLSSHWDGWTGSLASPWVGLVGSFQRALGPRFAGRPLTGYRQAAPGVTETRFGDYSVTASWGPSGFEVDGFGIAPRGFLARTDGGGLVAGAFAGTFNGRPLSDGTHYLIFERDGAAVTVRQPLGGDTAIAVDPPPGGRLRTEALAPDGRLLGEVEGGLEGGRFVFLYSGTLGGERVGSYRVRAA